MGWNVCSMSNIRRSGEFVVPGERIGVIEEFIPNFGTYVENGVIYSRNAGYLLIDSAARKVSVYPAAKGLSFPKIGSIVVGYVVNIQGSTAFLSASSGVLFPLVRTVITGLATSGCDIL
jgi:exosome complex component CSL4